MHDDDMEKDGWILLHRKLTDHWLWENDKYLKRWLTILMFVNHKPAKFNVGNALHICEPGSSYRSLEEWGRLFRTNKRNVKNFFSLLQGDVMISCQILGKGNQRKHLLSVVNWEHYQKIGTRKGTESGTEKVPRTNNEERMIKESTGFGDEFVKHWYLWKEYKSVEHKFKFKSEISESGALTELKNISENNENKAIAIIKQSIAKGWQGLFKLNGEKNKGKLSGHQDLSAQNHDLKPGDV
jgi:hypothetical protein